MTEFDFGYGRRIFIENPYAEDVRIKTYPDGKNVEFVLKPAGELEWWARQDHESIINVKEHTPIYSKIHSTIRFPVLKRVGDIKEVRAYLDDLVEEYYSADYRTRYNAYAREGTHGELVKVDIDNEPEMANAHIYLNETTKDEEIVYDIVEDLDDMIRRVYRRFK